MREEFTKEEKGILIKALSYYELKEAEMIRHYPITLQKERENYVKDCVGLKHKIAESLYNLNPQPPCQTQPKQRRKKKSFKSLEKSFCYASPAFYENGGVNTCIEMQLLDEVTVEDVEKFIRQALKEQRAEIEKEMKNRIIKESKQELF